jgi:hypothetical protein
MRSIEQFVEVVGHARTRRVFQPLVVHRKALDEELLEPGRRPLAELRAARTAHAVTHGQDEGQAVVAHLAGNAPGALQSNY